jgi:hypothetical protein
MHRKHVWAIVATAAVAVSSLLVQKGLDQAWRIAKDEDPPADPSDRNVDWTDAIVWTVATGVAVGLGRLVARRGAAAGWHRLTGDAPPS